LNRSYIIATKTHKIDPEDNDTDFQFFLDFDLAILGKPEDGYNRYANQIRQEYIHVPNEKYVVGRPAVLEHLMQGQLFFTEEFRTLFEDKAKENVRREIASLRAGNFL
jgi:predicted metal-dependent HD superfamily phosphohydrolase